MTRFPYVSDDQRMEMLAPQPGRVRVVIDTDAANGCRQERFRRNKLSAEREYSAENNQPAGQHSKRLTSAGLIISMGHGRVALVDPSARRFGASAATEGFRDPPELNHNRTDPVT